MPETEQPIKIERNLPQGERHPIANRASLEAITEQNIASQEVVRLVDYFKDIAGKPRGSKGGSEDLNSHREQFIVKQGEKIKLASLEELQQLLKDHGIDTEILGVQSISQDNQRIEAVVQGVDRNKPTTGYERPTVAEGPHMILAAYAKDKNGQLHIFRTIQMRTGEAMIDTPRGFAEKKALEDGTQMYADIEENEKQIATSMKKIVSDETGEALQIKRIRYIGSDRVNSSFVTSKSAVFGVEVDYDAFLKNKRVVALEELKRRKEQFEHEGIVGDVLDMTLSQYVEYKRDSDISKDMAADFGTDTIAILDMFEQQEKTEQERQDRLKLIKDTKESSPQAREAYLKWTIEQAKQRGLKPNLEKAEKYLDKINPKAPIAEPTTKKPSEFPIRKPGIWEKTKRFLSGK
jgi:hypothetical protein